MRRHFFVYSYESAVFSDQIVYRIPTKFATETIFGNTHKNIVRAVSSKTHVFIEECLGGSRKKYRSDFTSLTYDSNLIGVLL